MVVIVVAVVVFTICCVFVCLAAWAENVDYEDDDSWEQRLHALNSLPIRFELRVVKSLSVLEVEVDCTPLTMKCKIVIILRS